MTTMSDSESNAFGAVRESVHTLTYRSDHGPLLVYVVSFLFGCFAGWELTRAAVPDLQSLEIRHAIALGFSLPAGLIGLGCLWVNDQTQFGAFKVWLARLCGGVFAGFGALQLGWLLYAYPHLCAALTQ